MSKSQRERSWDPLHFLKEKERILTNIFIKCKLNYINYMLHILRIFTFIH